ncbi:hypothetical protein CMV30_06985 [Nibricoccus aquaticus]|uniref:Uncharacterized protein n=1 Tax=Nibricoccus aquaticus TaxID=2576891 RepID=A0A290Q619_9BACT|nr:hypothetical protein CMV30_06985 [Nibricoccus aquaticus]
MRLRVHLLDHRQHRPIPLDHERRPRRPPVLPPIKLLVDYSIRRLREQIPRIAHQHQAPLTALIDAPLAPTPLPAPTPNFSARRLCDPAVSRLIATKS